MTPLVPALSAVCVLVGLFVLVLGVLPAPARSPRPLRQGARRLSLSKDVLRRRSTVVGVGLVLGVLGWLLTGIAAVALIVPGALLLVPTLLGRSASAARIERLEALEEWIRHVAGIRVAGLGLEGALVASLRSAPPRIRPEVSRLVARIQARGDTRRALRAFADDFDDPAGDVVAMSLLLAADRRGPGLAESLRSLAESVAADVAARRRVETDRETPRTTVRLVTLITVVVLCLLSLTGDYIAPYRTVLGQMVLLVLLAAYGCVLLWLRRMSSGSPTPRLLAPVEETR